MVAKLRERDIQLVVLAGCMVIFTNELVDAYPNAIMNVHPALIPSFCGKACHHAVVVDRAAVEVESRGQLGGAGAAMLGNDQRSALLGIQSVVESCLP